MLLISHKYDGFVFDVVLTKSDVISQNIRRAWITSAIICKILLSKRSGVMNKCKPNYECYVNALLITVTRFIINQFITTPCIQSLLALARRGINPYHSCTLHSEYYSYIKNKIKFIGFKSSQNESRTMFQWKKSVEKLLRFISLQCFKYYAFFTYYAYCISI